MNALLILVVALFPIGILLRKTFPRLCALCFATALSWGIGLVYITTNGAGVTSADLLALGILMGGSAVGGMYYLFSNVSEEKQLFKLPYLVTAFVLVYAVLLRKPSVEMAAGIGMVWLLFLALYGSRNVAYLKKSIRQIIECCKNW